MKHVPITQRLKDLRLRAGLSMERMAKVMKLRRASSYQRYEDPEKFKRKYLHYEQVYLLQRGLIGRGSPPITASEIKALGGPLEDDPGLRAIAETIAPGKIEALIRLLQNRVEIEPERPGGKDGNGKDSPR